MVHVPLFRDAPFAGRSARGLYGDCVEEIDWSTGRILDTLRRLELDRHTLVVFTSDNGPWLPYNEQGGSAGLLKGGKGSTYDGGMRVNGLFWWPGTVQPGVVHDLGATLDLLPTCAALAGAPLPERELDGHDLSPALRGTGRSPREIVWYYRGTRVFAVRKGPYKLSLITRHGYRGREQKHDPPLLHHLDNDPSERHDIAARHPEIAAELAQLARDRIAAVRPGASQLERR